MRLHKQKLRNIKTHVKTSINKMTGKEYIPNPKEHLYIEPSSVCNLKCKFCGYDKSARFKTIMSNDLFYNIIEQATAFGYDNFGLTPMTGEVFVDNNFLAKLQIMESNTNVKGYSFFSNYILANEEFHSFLLKTKKLKSLTVSLYGHDLATFEKLTGGSEKQYSALLNNVDSLLEIFKITGGKFSLNFGLRSTNNYKTDLHGSDLGYLINKAKSLGVDITVTRQYNNWGGLINEEDIEDIDINLSDSKRSKQGPCSLIFYKNLVMANGQINACACRDADGTMTIGDLNNQLFEDIYSINNPLLMNIINGQLRNKFSKVCKACDFYRSIYMQHGVYSSHSKEQISLREFLDRISS